MSVRRRKADDAPEVQLPITAYLDFAFQLLAFFVLSYRPTPLEGQMEMSLPTDKAATAAKDPTQVDPTKHAEPKEELELPSNVSVVVRTQHAGDQNDGKISELRIQQLTDPDGKRVDNLNRLLEELTKLRKELNNKEGIKLQADSRLKWAYVVQVMDVCRKAGFNNISFAPPPELPATP